MRKAIIPLLLLSAVCVTPASANWFSNPRLGVNLNVGSAPNPKPADIRELSEVQETQTVVAAAPPPPPPPPNVPAPYVEPAPPPPAAAVILPAREFMVFFDFDKSNLTTEAREIVSAAVKTAKDRGAVRIVVTGHTDTVGSLRYNQALSERRANSVKAEMVKQGMEGAMIATVGKSFTDPLVTTGPGVREPQNRRAVIDIGSGAIASNE
jgi:outer membrane protein OmpA-like peptidoglycan-associated protein